MRTIGPERVLLLLYGLFVVAAGARSNVQLTTHAGRAPLAYSLSLGAALVYAAGFVLVRRAAAGRGTSLARGFAIGELAAVIAVGLWSAMRPSAFPDATVWSDFGAGYLFLPLLVPVGVLLWLRADGHASPTQARNGTCRFRNSVDPEPVSRRIWPSTPTSSPSRRSSPGSGRT